MDIKAKENNLTGSIKQKETNIFGVISRIHNPNAVFIKNINNDGTITAEYLDGEITTFNNKNLDPYYEEVVDSETNKRFRKLKPQIVSELTQKPIEQLTDDDFNNVANYFQQQTVSELVRGNNKNGVLDKSIFELNLNLDENNELNIPLNINGQDITLPINSASQSEKNINRYKELLQKDPNTLSESELTEKKAIEDIAINDAITARQQYNINEKYNALDVSKLNLTMENRDIKITPTLAKSMTTGEYWATFAGKSFKEGLAAVSTGILGLFDYYENEQEREAHKADIVGYVPQSYRVAEQQAMEKAMAAMERGDILEAAWHAKFQVLPEIAQEVGELLVTAIAMGAVTAATGGLGGSAAAVVTGAKLSKAISKASKIGLTLSKYLVAPVATSADQYLTGVATYEANNNEPMSLARRSTYMLGLAMTNAVDLALIKQAGKIALGTAHKAVDSITDPVKKKMAKGALARYATATLGGGAGEGLQEYVQQIFDTSMTQNQADGKTLIEIALDPETQFSALMGAMVGGTVGAGANAVGDTLGKTFQGIKAGAKAIGSGISSVSSSITNNKAGINNSKNVVQGLSSIEKSINLANDSDTIAQAETLVSNFKANVDNGNYDINENDIHRINTLEAKLALKKEAVQSGSIAAYTKDSSAFIKDFIMDFSDTVSDFATATDPTTLQQQSEFLWANRGKIKALKNYIAQGRITVDKETKNVLDSAEQTFNEISGGVIDSAEPDNDFIEELLNDKEDRFFYMYENANEEQKQKLAEIASQDQDLKHLVEKDKNGKISIKKSLADVRIETTKGKHGTNTYSEAINFYNKKLIRLERKAKKEDLTPKEERQKVYYEGKISSYKNTVIHFLDTQVKKLKEFADIYKYPTEEDIIDPETGKTIGVIIGRYEGVDPQGKPSSFEVNKGDDEKAPSKSGSGKVIAETIDNLKRINRLLKKRYIPTETKNEVKQSLQDANEAIETINGILSNKGVAKSDLHEYIQIGNRRTQNTPSEATKSSTINDNKKQIENTTKEEKTIVEAKKDTTEESTKKEDKKETKTEPKQEVVNEKKEETNVIDTQDNEIEELNTIEEQDNQIENTTTTDDNTDNNIKENDIEKSIKEIEEEIANSKTVDELSDKTIDDMIDSVEDISTNSEGMADHDIGTRYFKGTVWYLYKYLIDRLNYKLRKIKYNKDELTRDDKIALYSLWFFLKLHNTMPFTPKGRVKTMLDIRDPLFTKFLKRITGKNFISYDDLRKYHPYYWEKIIVKKDTEVDIAKDRKVRKKSVEEIIAEIEENIKKDTPEFVEYMKIEKPTGNKELLKRNIIHIPVWFGRSKEGVVESISRSVLNLINKEHDAVLIKMQGNTIPIVDYLLKQGVPVILLGSYNEEFIDYYKKLPDNLKDKVCTIHISHNNKVKGDGNNVFYSHTIQQELMSALANVIYDFFPQDNYNILWNRRTANIVLVEKTNKSKKNTQTKEENNKEQTETTNKETKPEPVEEENKLESVEEEITPEPVEEETEPDIVEEETQQVNTEDENIETDSTSSNKEKLDTLLRNIRGRINRLIELGAIFSDDDYQFLEEFDNDFSKISEYKRYVKRHGVEFVKANYMDLIKKVFDKYDSYPYEELDDDYIDDLDESTIDDYFEFLTNLMFEIRDEIISKSKDEFEKLYKDKTPSEYWNKIYNNPTIDDLKELQSFIENLVASENHYLDGRMSKEADERFHIVKNEINDYLEDLDNEDTDTTSEEVEENTLSEATESSVNEDSKEEVDNTTEEESLVTEPENDVYVEENEEVVQEPSTTKENKRKSIDEINAELSGYYGEEPEYFDEYEQNDTSQDDYKTQTKEENEEAWRRHKVKEFQDANVASIKKDSIFDFGKPREINIQVGNEAITFNSINHAIASLGHNKSADPEKWTLNKEEYNKEKWKEKEERHKIDQNTFEQLNEETNYTVIVLALKDLFFRDKEFRKELTSISSRNRRFVTETSEEYLALEEKLEEIDKRIRYKYGDNPVGFDDILFKERLEILNAFSLLGRNDVNFTQAGIEHFIEAFGFDINSVKESFDKGKPTLLYNAITKSVEIITPSKDTGYTVIPYDKMSKDSRDILDLLFMSGDSSENRIAEWKSFFKKFSSKNTGTFNKENPDVNKVTTTFYKDKTPIFEITTTKNKQEGGYIYKLIFLSESENENENKIEIEFNSHPILATKTKDHSLLSRSTIRENYINEKDEKYGVKDLREDIDNKRELIKQLKSLWFGLGFFKDNFAVLAENTLTNKIEMIDKYLNNKVKKLEEDYPTLKQDLQTIEVDIDTLLEKSKQLRESNDNFNDTKILSFVEEQISTIGQAIDKYSLDIKTKESQIKATYKAENAKKEEEKPNKIQEKIREYIKKTFKLNESKSHYFAVIEYQKLFNEDPVEFVYTLLKEIDDLSIKITKAKQLLLTDDLNTKIEEVKQLLQTDDPIFNKTEISNAKLNYEERLEVLKKIREVAKIPAQVNISDKIKEKTDKELLNYIDSIYLIASDIEEALDDLLIKNLIPEFVNKETKETYLHKIEGQFIVALKTKEATTILPTTEEFSEENARIKEELKNLFNIYNGAKVENRKIVKEGIVKDNAAYAMLTNIPNFALAVDFAVAELFYTNTKILNDPTVYMSSVIDDLGKSVLNALGLQLNPATTSLSLENQIIQDIGYLALNYAENMGYVETGNVSIDGMATNAVKNTTNEYDREVLNHKYELLTTKPKKKSGTYSFVKEELPKRRERNPESVSLQDANKKLMATPFRVNYEAIDLIEQNRYSVQRALGWLTEEEIQDLPTKDLQISQVGINQQIEKSIDELITLKKEAELNGDNKPEYIYFNTFSATNTRMHIDSSTINPQNDKLHRFLFSPVSKEEDLTKEKTINSDLLIQQFTYAIGQGLGLPVDKNTNEARSEWFEKIKTHLIGNKDNISNLKTALLSNNKAEIEKIGKEIYLPIEVEEFSHFLQALLVLEDTRIEKDGSVVVGAKGVQFLTVEHDSASSGLVIRILTSGVFAFNGLDELNKALGVYTKETEAVDSRNAFFKTEGAVDVYQTAAVDLKEDVIDTPENIQKLEQNSFRAGYKGLPSNDEDKSSIHLPFVILEYSTNGKDKKVEQDMRKDMFNDLKSFLGFSKDNKVSKALRSFMKSLVMPFGYQIGFSGALETATEEYINDLMLKFMRATTEEEINGRNNFLDRILPYFEGVNNNVFSIDVKAIKITENMSNDEKAKAREVFLKLIKHVQYKDLKFNVPVAIANPEIKEKRNKDGSVSYPTLDSDADYKYTSNTEMIISFSDIIQHTVMYMYTGTLYENLRQKFGELRGSAVFNSLVNQFSAEHRIYELEKNDYIRRDKQGIYLAYRQIVEKKSVEKLNKDKESGKVISIKFRNKIEPKLVSEHSTVSETVIKRKDPNTRKTINVEAYEIIFTSPLLNMPAKEARKILSGTGLGLTGLPIHSSPDIYLDSVEIELETTSDSVLAMKAIKTEMPINYKEQNLAHTKIQLDNDTTSQSNVTKALAVPLDVSITGSGARLAAVTVHNLDAEIMAHTVNKNVGQVLPVFDAIVSSPFAVKDSSTALNEGIYQVAMETSIEDRSLAAINKISSYINEHIEADENKYSNMLTNPEKLNALIQLKAENKNKLKKITIGVAEAQLVKKYLTELGVEEEKINALLPRKETISPPPSMKIRYYNSVEIDVNVYQEVLQEVTKKVKELKEKNKNTITVANVDGIDGTAYSKTKTEAPNQNPKTNDDVYNYFYSQGTEDDKNDFEDVMFSDNDAEARLNLFDTLVGNSHVDTTGWFSQVKELLQSLGSLRLNSLGVSLVEGLGIYGEYNKSNHTVYLERSTIPNTSDRYRHPAIRYAHELIHAIMATALDQANKLGITKEVGQLFDLYNIASKHLTPEDFLPEYYNNYEEAIQEAKATYDYIFSNSLENNKRLRGLNEFIAYALTDERLARKLQSILIQQKSDKKQSLWSRLKEIVRTIFNIAKPEENKDLDGLMANLVDLFKENKDLNAFEALQNLVQKIVDADNKAMQQAEEQNPFSGIKKLIYTAGEKAIIPANKTIGGFIQNLITITDNITNYDKLMSTLQNETGEYNLRTRLIATSKILLNVLTSSKARKKLPQVLNYIGLTTFASYNFVGRWIDEMKEADEYKRTIEDKARASRKIDQNAQGIKNITISQLTELFKDENRPNGLSEEEKAMLTDIVLKLDLSCLKKRENGKDIPITADDLKNLMTDNEKIDETISSLRKELLDITQDETLHYDSKTRTLLLNKITMLADYLATGNVYITGATNARSVRQSVESDKNVNNRNRKAREIENLIDQLASLMALKQIPLSNRQQVASMSTEGLDAFINIHRTNKENDYDYYVQISGTSEKNIPFAKAYDNLSKGFTKVISNNSYDVVIGYANQAEFYNQKGFKPIPDVIAGEIGGEKLLYYKNGFNSKASRNGAAYVYTGFDKIGKSMMLIAEEELQFKDTGLNFAGMSNADKIRRLTDEYITRVGKQAKALTAPLSDKELTIEELRNLNKNYKNVYPVYNQHGGVQDYNIIPPKEVKKQLSITDDAFRILGEMVATNLRREQGSELNNELLDFIFKESDIFSSLNARPDANAISHDNDNNRWIPITPDSFDPFARQMWEELDSNLRQYILTYMKATNKPLYIREDALLDVFGQKDIAVSNVITRNLPVFRQAIQVLGMIAKFVATEYKGLVVIKTPQVLIGNVLSNVALALVQGINPVDIIKSYVSDFRAIQDYEKTDKRLKELQFKVNITNDTKKKLEINREIEILKSKLQNNSVHELMNLGYKQTIVEDISNTDFDNSSYFDSKIERARKTLPRPLLAGFDILFMTKRTAGYQFMHKMTGYSDLLARSVEYKHKKKQIEKKYKVGTEEYEEAMHKLHGQLADNYINYDKPQSAVEQWLNDMGLVLFTKFFKRIQSVIVNHVIDNPLGVAAFLTANTVVDVPNIFETSIAVRDLTAYTHNPVDFIGELITPPLLNLLSNDNKMQDV